MRKVLIVFLIFIMLSPLSSCFDKLGVEKCVKESKDNSSVSNQASESSIPDQSIQETAQEQESERLNQTETTQSQDTSHKTDPTTSQHDPVDPNQSDDSQHIYYDRLVTIFTDPESEEFRQLENSGKPIQFLENNLNHDLAKPIRFRIEADEATVRLEYGDFSVNMMHFHPIMEVFSVQGNVGDLFEFDGFITESIPNFKLIATLGDFYSDWDFLYNGKEEEKVVIMPVEIWQPEPLTEDHSFMNICRAIAMTQLSYDTSHYVFGADTGSGYFYETDHYYWLCLSEAVGLYNMDYYQNDINTKYDPISMEEWLFDAFIDTIYWNLRNDLPAPDDYLVTYTPERHEKYDVLPVYNYLTENVRLDVFTIYEIEPGIWEVEYWANDLDHGFSAHYRINLQSLYYPDGNNPFSYMVTGLERLEIVLPQDQP